MLNEKYENYIYANKINTHSANINKYKYDKYLHYERELSDNTQYSYRAMF